MNKFVPALVAVFLGAGCAQAPTARSPRVAVGGEAGSMDVSVGVALQAARSLLSVAGSDVATLIVGVFDQGSTAAPSFGYRYTSAYGTPVSVADVADINSAAWLGDLLTYRMAAYANAGDSRRYVVREYDANIAGLSEVSVAFNKLPRSSEHSYMAFAAAYDGANANLAFATGSVDGMAISANSATSTRIALTLDSTLFTAGLSVTAAFQTSTAQAF